MSTFYTDTIHDGILRFQTVTYRMYIFTFVAKRADGRIVPNEEKLQPANNGAMRDSWIGVEISYLGLHKATIWTDIN